MKGAGLCQGPSQSPAQFVSVQQSSAQVNPLSSSAWGRAFLVQGSLEPAELREQPQPCWEGALHSLSAEQSWWVMLEAQTDECINLFTHKYNKVQFYNPWDYELRGLHSLPVFTFSSFPISSVALEAIYKELFLFHCPFSKQLPPAQICFSQGKEGKGARGWKLLTSWEQQHFVPAVHLAAAKHLPKRKNWLCLLEE